MINSINERGVTPWIQQEVTHCIDNLSNKLFYRNNSDYQEKNIRPHWSYSSINEYLTCPLKYYFHRVLLKKNATINTNLILGKILNRIYLLILNLVYPMQIEPLNIAELNDFLKQEFLREKLAVDTEIFFKAQVYVSIIANYLKAKKFNDKEIWSEKKFIVPLEFKAQVIELPLMGILKLVVINPQKKTAKIIQFKTSSRKYDEWKIPKNIQMLCYCYALYQLLKNNYAISFIWEVLLKQSKPDLIQYEYQFKLADIAYFFNMVAMVNKAVKNNIFFPCRSYLCCSCPYIQSCNQYNF